jgi:2-amino-4-hydroxy-6-hydroxymethyldihydropteridine diphosphokinase
LDTEASLGRARSARNESRIIDLDLLLYGEEQIAEAGLIVPHPGIAQRRFVLEPLAELAPNLRHPLLGQTVLQLAVLARSGTSQGVSRICDNQWMNSEQSVHHLDGDSHGT